MRRLLPALAIPVLLALAASPAEGQLPQGEDVDVTAVRVPDLVVVDNAFGVEVDVTNRLDEDVTVQLHSFLYVKSEERVCGSHADDRFRGTVDRGARPNINLAPHESRTYPASSTPWYHVVNLSQVGESGTYQLCVFALEPGTDGITYYDYHPVDLEVRVSNALPAVDFRFGPDRGNVTTTFTFEALVEDDPDGDDLLYQWDFGHLDTQGRATAEGAVVDHRFFHFSPSPKEYDVTLTVSDGFAETSMVKAVIVDPEGVARPQQVELGDDDPKGLLARLLPAPALAMVLAVTMVAARLRRR